MSVSDGPGRLLAAVVALVVVIVGLWAWNARLVRASRRALERHDARGVAWVRFGRDGSFKGDAGWLVVGNDGTVSFTPTASYGKRGSPAETWPPGRVSLRWLGGPARDLLVGPRRRVLELKQDGAKRQMAAYAVVGRLV